MSKLTRRKSMEYIKKDYVRTRTMPANWYLSSYNYKFNITHMQPLREKLKQKKIHIKKNGMMKMKMVSGGGFVAYLKKID